jgi:hypothetical protein
MDTKTIVSYVFPPELWTPFTSIFSGAGNIGLYILGVLFWVTIAFYFFSTWYQSYKASGSPSTFPIGVLVLFLVLFILLICFSASLGDVSVFGYNLFGMNKCPSDKPDMNSGLCYTNCDAGYHGRGPVCWADTISRGIGTPAGLAPCRDGYRTEGLICSSVGWDSCRYNTIIGCIGGFTGDFYGRMDDGGVCPGPSDFGGDLGAYDGNYRNYTASTDPDKEKGVHPEATPLFNTPPIGRIHPPNMCYKKCPDGGWTSVDGMPYLCIRTKPGTNDAIPLSYGRGAGVPPHWIKLLDKEQVKYIF